MHKILCKDKKKPLLQNQWITKMHRQDLSVRVFNDPASPADWTSDDAAICLTGGAIVLHWHGPWKYRLVDTVATQATIRRGGRGQRRMTGKSGGMWDMGLVKRGSHTGVAPLELALLTPARRFFPTWGLIESHRTVELSGLGAPNHFCSSFHERSKRLLQ